MKKKQDPASGSDSNNIWMIVAILSLYYLILLFPFASKVHFTGDEPQYLIITHSLITDGDLDLKNNFENRDYRHFFRWDLQCYVSPNSREGHMYSYRSTGLPILLVPFYYLGLKLGYLRHFCLLFPILLMILSAVNMYILCRFYFKNSRLCFLAILMVFMSLPVSGYAFQLYPEVVTFFAVILLLKLYVRGEISVIMSALIGVGIGFLPWVHNKFMIYSVPFLLLFLLSKSIYKKEKSRYLLLFFAVAMLAGLSVKYHNMFATANLIKGPYSSTFTFNALIHGILGMFLDQQLGLFIYAPFFIFSLAGLILFMKNLDFHKREYLAFIVLLFCSGLFLAISAAYNRPEMESVPDWYGGMGWDGGFCIAGRFILPTIPLLIIAIITFADRFAWSRRVIGVFSSWSIVFSVVSLAFFPLFLFGIFHDGNVYLSVLSRGANDYRLLLPSLTEGDSSSSLLMALLMAMAIISLNLSFVFTKHKRTAMAISLIMLMGFCAYSAGHFLEGREFLQSRQYTGRELSVTGGETLGARAVLNPGIKNVLIHIQPDPRILRGKYRVDFIMNIRGEHREKPSDSIRLIVAVDDGRTVIHSYDFSEDDLKNYSDRGAFIKSINFEQKYPLKYTGFWVIRGGGTSTATVEVIGIRLTSCE